MFQQRPLKWLLGALVLATNAVTLHAQMAQDPLLSRTAAVEPNIVQRLGLSEALGMLRMRGLGAILHYVRAQVRRVNEPQA